MHTETRAKGSALKRLKSREEGVSLKSVVGVSLMEFNACASGLFKADTGIDRRIEKV